MLGSQPIRRQVALVTCVFVAALAGAASWSANRTSTERRAEVGAEAASLAMIAADYLNQYLDGLDALASALTRHPAVVTIDVSEIRRLFASLLKDQPLLLNVSVRASDGSLRASGLVPPADGLPPEPPPYVAQVLATGRPVTGELMSGPISQQSTIARAYPVRARDGSIVAVLGFGLNLRRLQDVYAGALLPAGSVVTLFDRHGRIISRSREADRYMGTTDGAMVRAGRGLSVSAFRPNIDGVARFHSDVPIERGPWLLSVGIPGSEVAKRVAPLRRRNLAIVLASVASLLVVSLLLTRQASRGLEALTSAARRIAAGDLSPPVVNDAQNLEMAELQHAFTLMAANLRETRAALDRQVEQERKMREVLLSLQRQIVRQERLAAVGLLVSGVAHELNNPLQAILGTVELLERSGHLSAEALDEIAFIKVQSGRAREIIRNLSRFGARQPGPPSVIDLRDVVSDVMQMRRRDIENSSIDITVEATCTGKVYANLTEIEQVVLNLVINAQQAIESSGRAQGRILIRVFDSARRVRLEVHDDGPGVTGADESKLFQPFFTTKPVGQGTGLGLSVSYGIIDSYGGLIGHYGNAWGGATFFFELSRTESSPDRPAAGQ